MKNPPDWCYFLINDSESPWVTPRSGDCSSVDRSSKLHVRKCGHLHAHIHCISVHKKAGTKVKEVHLLSDRPQQRDGVWVCGL